MFCEGYEKFFFEKLRKKNQRRKNHSHFESEERSEGESRSDAGLGGRSSESNQQMIIIKQFNSL